MLAGLIALLVGYATPARIEAFGADDLLFVDRYRTENCPPGLLPPHQSPISFSSISGVSGVYTVVSQPEKVIIRGTMKKT